MLLRQEYPWVLQNLYRDRTYHIQDLSDTGQNLYGYRSYQIHDLSDTEVPVGTTGLIQDRNYQIQDRTYTDTGVIRYMTYQMQELIINRTYSEAGVPVGTTELNQGHE